MSESMTQDSETVDFDLNISIEHYPDHGPMLLHEEWASLESDAVEITVSRDLISLRLMVRVEKEGEYVTEVINLRDIVTKVVLDHSIPALDEQD